MRVFLNPILSHIVRYVSASMKDYLAVSIHPPET